VAFKIIQKIKPDQIQDKTLDTAFLKKYYRQLQKMLVLKTSPDNPTGYFFCADYSEGEDLLIMGNQTPSYLKVFRAAGKGKDGFDKASVSIGNCFVLVEGTKKILCIMPNPSLAKGKKMLVLKALKKLRKSAMKQIAEIRWLKGPLVQEAEEQTSGTAQADQSAAPSAANATKNSNKGKAKPNDADANAPVVEKAEIVQKIKELQKGINKLKKDILPRFKKKAATERDAAFVKALRKAGNLWLSKLLLADPKLMAKFSSQRQQLQKGIPQWEELENKILGQKDGLAAQESLRKELKATVKRMNETRAAIKTLLKKVNFKALK
jgi:hypothetical protein